MSFSELKETETKTSKKVDGLVDELQKLWKEGCEKLGEAERGSESGFIRFLEVIINVWRNKHSLKYFYMFPFLFFFLCDS